MQTTDGERQDEMNVGSKKSRGTRKAWRESRCDMCLITPDSGVRSNSASGGAQIRQTMQRGIEDADMCFRLPPCSGPRVTPP